MPTPPVDPSESDPPDPPDDDLLSSLEERLADSGLDPLIALTEIITGPSGQSSTLGLHGREFGGARLEQILGAGGMGITYRGLLKDGTKVAVKILRQVGSEERERFENECAILSTLEHPSVVRYHSHGFADDGRAFLVMDLVDGVTLEQVLLELEDGEKELSPPALSMCGGARPSSRTDRVWLQRIAGFCRQIAAALAHAHERGVVHRDVKPANLIVRPDGTPVLVDFGLGRDLEREVTMTRTGAVVGTVGWMAPEQFDSSAARVGPSTDVYALGLLLYRLWTGRDLRLDLDDIVRFRSGPLRLSRAESDGLGLAELGVLYGCLEPEPGRRYADGAALASELGALAEGGSPRRRPPGWIGRWVRREGVRSWKRAGLVAAVALLGLLVWAMWPEAKRVYVGALDDHQLAKVVDDATGEELGLVLPIYDWRTERAGIHRFRMTSRHVTDMPFEIDFDAAFPSLVVLPVPRGFRKLAANGSADIDTRGLLSFRTFDPDLLSIEIAGTNYPLEIVPERTGHQIYYRRHGLELPSRGVRVLAPPGEHDVRWHYSDGSTCSFRTRVLNQQVCNHLDGYWLFQTAGKFRGYLGTAVEALPDWCSIDLGGSAIRWLDSTGLTYDGDPVDPDTRALIYDSRNSSIVPVAPGVPGTVLVTVRFPQPMRSFFLVSSYRRMATEGADLSLEWRTDGGTWQPLELLPYEPDRVLNEHPVLGAYARSEHFYLDVHGLKDPGVSEVQLRYEMRGARAPREFAFTRVLSSYVLSDRPDNALEIVADPSPKPRRLR